MQIQILFGVGCEDYLICLMSFITVNFQFFMKFTLVFLSKDIFIKLFYNHAFIEAKGVVPYTTKSINYFLN